MGISESCSWRRLAAFSLAPYAAAYPVAFHLLLAFGKRPPPARLFVSGTTHYSVLTPNRLGTMTGLLGCPDKLSTHAATFYTVGRAIAYSHITSPPASDFPHRTKGRQPEYPDSASNTRRVTFTMPAIVRYPTACMFVSPLRLALSPHAYLMRFPVSRTLSLRLGNTPLFVGSMPPAVRLRA